MDIRQELLETERKAAQLRDKLNQIEQLDKEKKVIEDSINSDKQKLLSAQEQLDSAKQYALEKLSIKVKLDERVAQLRKDRDEYVKAIDKQLAQLKLEIDDIDLSVGRTLERSYLEWWRLANKPNNTQQVLQSAQGYNIYATEQARQRNTKMYRDFDKFYISVIHQVGVV